MEKFDFFSISEATLIGAKVSADVTQGLIKPGVGKAPRGVGRTVDPKQSAGNCIGGKAGINGTRAAGQMCVGFEHCMAHVFFFWAPCQSDKAAVWRNFRQVEQQCPFRFRLQQKINCFPVFISNHFPAMRCKGFQYIYIPRFPDGIAIPAKLLGASGKSQAEAL